MGSSPDWDTLWPLAPGQREPRTNYLRVRHKAQQGISEDLLQSGGAAVPGSGKCPRISSQSSGFVAQLQPRCPGGTSGLPGPPGTSSSLPRQTDTCSWLKTESSQPSSAAPPRSQQKSCCACVFTIITNHTRKIR